MQKVLFEKVYNHPMINAEDLEEIIEAHTKIDFSKGDLFLENGKRANEYFLIEEGLFRSYASDYQGNEITTGFFSGEEILIEVSSLFQRIPSKESLIAITNGCTWKIEFETFQNLFHNIEGLREWGRAWMSQQLFISKQQSIDMRTKSAADRYLMFLHTRPEIIQHSPLKYIASYLGITDTSLSRIRKEILFT